MPKGQVTEQDWPFVEGWYRMRLESVVENENEFTYQAKHAAVKRGDAKVGAKGVVKDWKWNMTFVGGDNNGSKLKVGTFPKISSREGDVAKILYEAFLGRELELGEDYDTDMIEGREADVHVVHDLDTESRSGKRFSTVDQAVPSGQGNKVAETTYDDEPPW